MPPSKGKTLLDETELLIKGIVRDARRGEVITVAGPDGTTHTERRPAEVLDRVRAADAALRFMVIKNKLKPEETESEFDRLQNEFHSEGEGGDAESEADD